MTTETTIETCHVCGEAHANLYVGLDVDGNPAPTCGGCYEYGTGESLWGAEEWTR